MVSAWLVVGQLKGLRSRCRSPCRYSGGEELILGVAQGKTLGFYHRPQSFLHWPPAADMAQSTSHGGAVPSLETHSSADFAVPPPRAVGASLRARLL